ncbi:MAG: DHH family phosphoesterase [Eubacteriaceae bacterium]
MINSIIDLIKKSNKILIITHKGPDGDAVGSVCALGLLLKELGKEVTYVMDNLISGKMKIEKESDYFVQTTEDKFDLAIALDCSEKTFLFGHEYLQNANEVAVIDHHITNKKYGDKNYVSHKVAAVGEIIIDIYKILNVNISYEAAAWLYLSLATDTGNFRYSNVTADTHKKTAMLYEIRSDFDKINKQIEQYGLTRLKYLSKVIKNIIVYNNNKVIISYIEINDYVNKTLDEEAEMQLQNMIDIIRNVENIEVAVLIKQAENELFKVSLRSNGDFDVAAVAKQYGGGGHKKAAGCNANGNIGNIISELKKTITVQ